MTDRERYRRTDRTQDVIFVFGALSAEHVPGPALVRILEGMGMSESVARNTLTKMVRQRALLAEPSGRMRIYSMPPGVETKYRQIAGSDGPTPWSGEFSSVIYRAPESVRWYRDRLQYTAPYFGYGMLRPGVLVSAHDRATDLLARLGEAPQEVATHVCALRPTDLAEARRITASTWDLHEISAQYAQVSARIERRIREWPNIPDGVDTTWRLFREWNDVYREVIELQMQDPHLPAELLPSAWPRADHMERLGELNRLWGPRLQAFVRAQAEEAAPRLTVYVDPAWG